LPSIHPSWPPRKLSLLIYLTGGGLGNVPEDDADFILAVLPGMRLRGFAPAALEQQRDGRQAGRPNCSLLRNPGGEKTADALYSGCGAGGLRAG
jgi:hypothetical protein